MNDHLLGKGDVAQRGTARAARPRSQGESALCSQSSLHGLLQFGYRFFSEKLSTAFEQGHEA